MRVIRRKGGFGWQVEVAGPAPESSAVKLARAMERPVGRGGGRRDPLPGKPRERFNRDRYVSVSVSRSVGEWIDRQADARGLSRASFMGMLIEGASAISPDDLDDLLSREAEGLK